MADHQLGPPANKKARLGSPSLNTPSDNNEFNFTNLNFDGIVNDLPDDLEIQGTSSDTQVNQDSGLPGSLSSLLSRSTPNSQQSSLPVPVNSVGGGIQTSRSPGMGGMINMGMNKNPMVNNLATPLVNMKAATSSHLANMNDGLVSSASFTMSGSNPPGLMGGMNTMGVKQPMGTQMIGNVGSLNIGQQIPNQMMNGPGNFQNNIGQMRLPNSGVNPQASMSMPTQGNMMPNPGMSQMQSHQGMPGHPNINMQQNTNQMIRAGQPTASGTSVPHQASADPDKSKLIQQQLVLLLHAHKCQKREQQANGDQDCKILYCRTMKNVLNHMTTCQKGKSCEVAHCASSRQIITHWKNCTRSDCPVCLPLKTADKRNTTANANQNATMTAPNSQASNVRDTQAVKRAYESLGLQFNQTSADHNSTHGHPQMNSMGSDGQMNKSLPLQGQKVLPNQNSGMQMGMMNAIPGANQGLQLSAVSGQQLANSTAAAAAMGAAPDIVKTIPPSNRKDWHAQVTQDLRNHLVHKLVQAIFPTPDPAALRDSRMKNLVAYARKVEGDMYETANNRGEYYHLLAEKIYKIQKELEEKRIQRMRVQNPNVTSSLVGPIRPVMQNGPTSNQVASPHFNDISALQQQQQQPVQQAAGLQQMKRNLNMRSTPPPANQIPGPVTSTPMSVNAALAESQHQFDMKRPSAMGRMIPNATAASSQQLLQQQLSSQAVQSQASNQQGLMNAQQANTVSVGASLTDNNLLNQRLVNPGATATVGQLDNMGANNVHVSAPQQSLLQQLTVPAVTSASQLNTRPQNNGQISSKDMNNDSSHGKEEFKPESGGKDMTENNQNLSSLLAAASSPSTLPLTSGTPSFVNAANATMSSNQTSLTFKSDVKADIELKTEVDLKEEKMDIKTEPKEVKTEPIASKEGESSSPKLENMDENSQASNNDDIKTPDSSNTTTSATPKPRCKKDWNPDELRQSLMPTLEKLVKQEPESLPFKQPVDPIVLHIPDYFEIIKKPMDLSTIRRKLDSGSYNDPWDYVDDVWLMFENAWLYNKKTSRVYKYASKLSEVFENEIDGVMQSLGYCCGRKHVFCPQVLCCYGKQLCTIPRDSMYYSYQNRYVYCEKCFQEIQTEEVELTEDPTQPATKIRKDQFEKVKNDQLDYEPFIDCLECGRKWHQICALWYESIWREGWTCDGCHKAKGTKRRENKFNAKRLPSTKLGTFLENRVNNFLRKKDSQAGDVTIRVLSSYDKSTEVKPLMKSKFGDEAPDCYPYRAKAMFAFEEIDGVDVCFFGMHVQEYGSTCPLPNRRRVYISYLDSVHFFRPRQLRTAVYHEILIGYLEYAKNMGYTTAHIWACPPSEGDDYIFHCHPPEQKIPKPKRLQEWYKKMLDKAIIERVVVDYKDIFKDAIDNGLNSAKDLAYFEGDFWPNVIEESIKELDQEEEEKKRREEAEAAAAEAEAQETVEETNDIDISGKKKGEKKGQRNKKANKSKGSARKNNRKANLPQGTNDLTAKLYNHMEKHKEVFFVIRLHNQQIAASLGMINDPDAQMNCDLMDGRDAFLTTAREKHYEFSSLRRAKLSSMALLYELHNQGKEAFVYTCNSCKAAVETRYHCSTCDDFDLCVACYKKEGHVHSMAKLGLGLDEITSSDKEENPQESRRKSIQRCINSLVHACQCKNANCFINACHKMKRVVAHTMSCRRKTNNGCPICKQLIALCCYHAKHCNENKCPVPFCPQLKQKLRQKQLLTNLHQAQMLRRRVAIMTGNTGTPASTPSTNSAHSSTVSPQDASSLPNQPYNGGGGKTGGPPPGALLAAQEAQNRAEAQRQKASSVGKPTNFGMQPSIRPTAPTTMMPSEGGKPINAPRSGWPQNYPGQAPQRPVGANPRMHNPQQTVATIGPTSGNPTPGATSAGAGGTAAVNTIFQAFKNQNLSQQEWLALLRRNPQLMSQVLQLKNKKKPPQAAGQQQPQPPQQPQMHPMPNMGQPMAQQGGQLPQQQMRNQMNMMTYRQQLQQQQNQTQVNQFAQPQQPFVRSRMGFPQQSFQNDSHNIHQFQQQQHMMQHHQAQMKQQMAGSQPMSPQFMLAQQANPSPQQMLQTVRSPPASAAGLPQAVRSPQPTPSPRQQPIPSPRQLQQSPHHNIVNNQSPMHNLGVGQDTGQLSNDHHLLGSLQTHNSMPQLQNSDVGLGQQENDVAPLTPQDQLNHYVSQM